jgi:chromate transport protein ChrA
LTFLTLWADSVLPLLLGLWIGGLLAATVWHIGRSDDKSANMLTSLMGMVAISMTLVRAYQPFPYIVINAIIFWLVLLVGRKSGIFFVSFWLLAHFLVFGSYSMPSVIGSSFLAWIAASMGKEIFRVHLTEKSFSQLCVGDFQDRNKEKINIGHVREW